MLTQREKIKDILVNVRDSALVWDRFDPGLYPKLEPSFVDQILSELDQARIEERKRIGEWLGDWLHTCLSPGTIAFVIPMSELNNIDALKRGEFPEGAQDGQG